MFRRITWTHFCLMTWLYKRRASSFFPSFCSTKPIWTLMKTSTTSQRQIFNRNTNRPLITGLKMANKMQDERSSNKLVQIKSLGHQHFNILIGYCFNISLQLLKIFEFWPTRWWTTQNWCHLQKHLDPQQMSSCTFLNENTGIDYKRHQQHRRWIERLQ